MRKYTLPLLILGTAVSAPAMAQSAVAGPFTGPRVEATIGYDNVSAGSDSDSNIQNDDQSIDGLMYGVGVGYDFNAGGVVLGVEGEYSGSTASVDYNNPEPNTFGFGRVDTGRDLYVGARAGILANPQTLIYVKGGYTNAQLNLQANDRANTIDRSYELDGFRVGAGIERAFTANTFGKIEYRYSNYSSADFGTDNSTLVDDFRVDTDRHQIAASVGYRF